MNSSSPVSSPSPGPGRVRRTFRWLITDPIIDSYRNGAKAPREGASFVRDQWVAVRSALSRRTYLTAERASQLQADFNEVRMAWGFTEAEEPQVLRGLLVHQWMVGLLCALGLWGSLVGVLVWSSWVMGLGGVAFASVCLMSWARLNYQYNVIRTRHWVSPPGFTPIKQA